MSLAAQPLPENEDSLLPEDLLHALNDSVNEEHVIPQINLNLQVGLMLHQESNMVDPVFEKFTMNMSNQTNFSANAKFYKTWGRYLSPVGDPHKQISIPLGWAPFFTSQLLNKDNFQWASNFLNSSPWEIMQQEGNSLNQLNFSLPLECPVKGAIYLGSEDALIPSDSLSDS
jgi:hypothetical protein